MGFVLLLMQSVVETVKCVMVLSGHEVPGPEPVEGLS